MFSPRDPSHLLWWWVGEWGVFCQNAEKPRLPKNGPRAKNTFRSTRTFDMHLRCKYTYHLGNEWQHTFINVCLINIWCSLNNQNFNWNKVQGRIDDVIMKRATSKATIPRKSHCRRWLVKGDLTCILNAKWTAYYMQNKGWPDLHFKCKVNRILHAK